MQEMKYVDANTYQSSIKRNERTRIQPRRATNRQPKKKEKIPGDM